MKKFLFKFILFCLPVLILLLGMELYFRNAPNSFITIANYFNANKQDVEVLILGSSHNQNGFNPKYCKANTLNLSYGQQDIQMDSALFFSNVKQMKHLKTVVFELDYHRMDIENGKDYFRLPWYYIYYNAEIYPVKWYNKLSLYTSNPEFFNNILLKEIKGESKIQTINKYGYSKAGFYTTQFIEAIE